MNRHSELSTGTSTMFELEAVEIARSALVTSCSLPSGNLTLTGINALSTKSPITPGSVKRC